MANEQNLRPSEYRLSQEEAKKGGIKSGETRRRKKSLREQMEMLLSLPVQDEQTRDFIESLGISREEVNNALAITLSMYQEALKGNTKAFELIRDTIGEKPTDRLQIEERPVIRLERPKK